MMKKLDELTNTDLQNLKKKNTTGNVVVFIHPYFVNSRVRSFENLIKKLKKGDIVIIGESHPYANELKAKIKKIQKPNTGTILFYTTKLDQSTPIMGWQKLITRLRLLGSTKVIVRGNNFGNTIWTRASLAAKEWFALKLNSESRTVRRAIKNNPRNTLLEQCAGYTSAKLTASGKFKVKSVPHRK